MATVTDLSTYGHNGTTNGSAFICSTQSKFGTKSLGIPENFDAGGNDQHYLSVPSSTDFAIGSGDFTIDFWLSVESFASFAGGGTVVFGHREAGTTWGGIWVSAANIGWHSLTSGTWDTNWTNTTATTFTAGVWYHIAIVRSGNTWYCFKDGTDLGCTLNVGAFSSSQMIGSGSANLTFPANAGWNEHGPYYIDEFRFSKGIARWTSNFTPPSSPY